MKDSDRSTLELLAAPKEPLRWVGLGLLDDVVSKENVAIALTARRWPFLLDPQAVALKFFERLGQDSETESSLEDGCDPERLGQVQELGHASHLFRAVTVMAGDVAADAALDHGQRRGDQLDALRRAPGCDPVLRRGADHDHAIAIVAVSGNGRQRTGAKHGRQALRAARLP